MHIIQLTYGPVPKDLAHVVKKTQQLARSSKCKYDLIKEPKLDTMLAIVIASDKKRFELAREMSDMVYVDLDCQPLRFLEQDSSHGQKPIHAFNRAQERQPQNCYFYVNGCCDYYKELEVRRLERKIAIDTYCWPAKLLRDTAVSMIPDDSYVHDGYSSFGLVEVIV